MTTSLFSLDDKYTQRTGSILLSGTQAIVRLLLMQQWRDRAAGLHTAGYVAGYRGSPLGGLDRELWRAKSLLEAHDIVFAPAINEEIAATAIWGAQQSAVMPQPSYAGVFGLWYGKGPGVDRAGDAFKHANMSGTARHGGVLAVLGDDHGAKSSTTAHQSEQAMVAAMMPVLYPASVQELLSFGLYGWALSRYSGLWVALKCVNETAEGSAIVDAEPLDRGLVVPAEPAGDDDVHVHMRFEPEATERRLLDVKLPRVADFARANALDRVIFRGTRRRLGIVTAGKPFLDVRRALEFLGIDAARADELGIGLYKLTLTWPVAAGGLREFAAGFEELLVVEEKRAFIEDQVARALYSLPPAVRPRLVGKRDENDRPLLRAYGTLEVHDIAAVIAARLEGLGVSDAAARRQLERLQAAGSRRATPPPELVRTPYFCSGCPHNRSTVVPDGSQAMAGIGCSYMAILMDRDTLAPTQMGGEGANWLGIAPFTKVPHIFQNLGDGTYVHSGLLAIRAAVAAGVSMTYKLLYNGTVAMTGGQPLEGALTVQALAAQLSAEGVRAIAVVTDEPDKYAGYRGFPAGVRVHNRRDLNAVQEALRATVGTTVLIYDQGCAAQKRRGRSRGTVPASPRRVFINSAVCEGCGDCSRKSNCVAVLPLDTPLGTKRRIDQSACNADLSCLEGFCPAFVSLEGAAVRRGPPGSAAFDDSSPLPDATAPAAACNLLIAGIGGTGIVTISAILAAAAQLEQKTCGVYDMTGLAQKNGAVMSHVRIGGRPAAEVPVRIGAGEATAVLACDAIVAGTSEALRTLSTTTRIVANRYVAPTGAFQRSGYAPPPAAVLLQDAAAIVGGANLEVFDATQTAVASLGDAVFANMVMLGFAWQRGLLPLRQESILAAIKLNGAAVAGNQQAFTLGRRAAAGAERTRDEAGQRPDDLPGSEADRLTELLHHRAAHLTAYQDDRYAARYLAFVRSIEAEEQERIGSSRSFSRAVAEALFKLMAYKDEYEVARLHTSPEFRAELLRQFSGDLRLRYHFAPPALGERKRVFGGWMSHVLRVLARMKFLRGTWLDPFGRSEERRLERALIGRYESLVRKLAGELSTGNHALATTIAALPMQIRGFGAIKRGSIDAVRREEERLLRQLHTMAAAPPAEPTRQAIVAAARAPC